MTESDSSPILGKKCIFGIIFDQTTNHETNPLPFNFHPPAISNDCFLH